MKKALLLVLFVALALSSFGITSMMERLGDTDSISTAQKDDLILTPDDGVIMLMVPLNIVTYCDMMWISEEHPTYSSVVAQWKILVADRYPKIKKEVIGEQCKFAMIILIFPFEEGKAFKVRWDDFVVKGRTPVKVIKENYLRTTGPRIVNSLTSTISETNMGTDMIYILYYDFLVKDDLRHPKVVFKNTYGNRGQIVWKEGIFETSNLMVQIYINSLEIYDYIK